MRSALEGENNGWMHDSSSFPSYIHYEFDSDASDEGAKDADALVTIINPVLAIINALQMQLKMSLDFSNLNLPFTCDQLKSGIVKNGQQICNNIPAFNLSLTCSSLPEPLYGVCNDANEADEDPTDGKTLASFKWDIWDIPSHIKYAYLEIGGAPVAACQPQLIGIIAALIDCEDPLGLWPIAEKIFLTPLSEKINCTVPPVSECAELADYDDVPDKCFCDGLTMTDSPNNLIFKGAHSGLLLATHNILQHLNLSIIDPFLPEDFDLATPVDNLLAEQGLNLIDLKHGKFGFFRGPDGRNDSKTWWKINSGKYQLDLYNTVDSCNMK